MTTPERSGLIVRQPDIDAAPPSAAVASSHWSGAAAIRPRGATSRRVPAWALVSATAFAVYLAAAWYIAFVIGDINGDSLSRTGQAMFVVMSRDPHLGAIGFVWNPLPSLVQIPLILVLHPLGLQAFAGPLHSALAMAATVGLLWGYLGTFATPRLQRIAFTAIFALNPMILLYAANGMSEALFLLFVVGTMYFFARWSRHGGYPMLIGMAVLTAVGFGARYETLALAGAGVFALVTVFLTTKDLEPARLEAILLTYLAPFVYAVFLWVFFNQLIMNDALFFLRSSYSNTAQTADFRETGGYLEGVVRSPLGSLQYAAARLFGVFPPFAGLLAAAVLSVVLRRNWRTLGLVAFALSIPAFHLLLLYQGASFGWLRFFLYSIPGSFFLAPPLLADLRRDGARALATAALLILFTASGAAAVALMVDPNVGREEHALIKKVLGSDTPLPPSRTFVEDKAIADYVDRRLPGQRVLIDTFTGYAIVVFSRQPAQFTITSDRDFEAAVDRPTVRADYVLVPKPSGFLSSVDRLNTRYPRIYEGAEAWTTLVEDFGGQAGWRLFKVKTAAAAP